jgi:hypothetical protein
VAAATIAMKILLLFQQKIEMESVFAAQIFIYFI